MMTNLLAILVSLAMMLTGASAPLAQPVSRTALISDITVSHNDEEVTLSPYVSFGMITDGAKVPCLISSLATATICTCPSRRWWTMQQPGGVQRQQQHDAENRPGRSTPCCPRPTRARRARSRWA